LSRPVRDEADFARVLLVRAPRRFDPGERSADDAYELQGFLGAGGFGEVWSARDLFTGERRALKFCLDPEASGWLRVEVDAVRRLYETLPDKTGLARFYRPNLHCDPPYLVMELCERGDLLDWMRRDAEALTPRAARGAFLLIPLLALSRAHAAGVVHRDLKPANILVGDDGRARLGDFGFARAAVERNMQSIVRSARSGMSAETMSLGVAGTGLYMAPEVKRGRVEPNDLNALKRGDVYSFGVTLAQTLAGDPELESGQLGRSRRKSLPKEIVELVDACVEPEPAERFADAGEVVAFLRENRLWPDAQTEKKPQALPVEEAKPVVAVVKTPPEPVKPTPALVQPTPALVQKSAEPEIFRFDIGGLMSMEFVLIPAGEFIMGSPETEWHRGVDESPRTEVFLSQGFLMARAPVTQGQWQAVMGNALQQEAGGGGTSWQLRGVGLDYPMYFVSWDRAMDFCAQLTKRIRRVVSLPSEAQWEYACRAGTATRFSFGDDPSMLGRYAWFEGNSHGSAREVGRKEPNPWGLYDMHGNVAEWCLDCKTAYPGGLAPDWRGPIKGTAGRAIRGGSWMNPEEKLRSAARFASAPEHPLRHVGFRVVAEVS
jgi:formylglycine-generating enzyme required for sulfatase activity